MEDLNPTRVSEAEKKKEKRKKEDQRLVRSARSLAFLARLFERTAQQSGLSLPQYRLLVFLRHGPKRAGELALRAAIKRPTLTALVDGLEREHRLRRVADERDGRGVRIEITNDGQTALQAVEENLCVVIDELCKLGDHARLLATLDDFAQCVDSDFERRMLESGSGWAESS